GRLERLPRSTVNKDTMLLPWNRLEMALQDTGDPIYLLSEVSPNADVRKAAEECVLKLSSLENELYQSVALYERIKALTLSDAIDREAQKSLLEEFEDRGVSLPTKKRERARVIFERLDKLQQDFARNLRDNQTKL